MTKKKEIKQFENEVVLHQNVARIRGRLTSLQSRSMLAILKKANDLVLENKNLKDFEIETKIFLDLIQFKDTGSLKSRLEKIAKHLRALMVQTFVWGTAEEINEAVFIQQIKINEESVTFKFSDYIREHIRPISNALIIKDFELIQSFRSEYARQLFKHLMMWEKKGELILSIEDLREYLGVPDSKSYERLDNLRRKVVNVAVDEINEKKPNFQLAYITKKKGREVVGFVFAWFPEIKKKTEKSDKNETNLNIENFIGKFVEKGKFKIISINQLDDDKYEVFTTDAFDAFIFNSYEILELTILENN